MALNAVLAKSFKELVATTPSLSVLLPGDLHHGRADTKTTRPFGSFTVTELEREYESGLGALVRYDLTLTIYGKQRVREVGEILRDFAGVMNRGGWHPVFPGDVGSFLSIVPTGSTMMEDETEEFGKDVMVGRSSWLILVNEYETVPT